VLQQFHGPRVLQFVVANVGERVKQRFDLGTTARLHRFEFRFAAARVHLVKQMIVLLRVVLHRHSRCRLLFQIVTVRLQECVVRLVGFFFHTLVQVVGQGGIGQVQGGHHPVVKERHVLRQEAIPPARVAAQTLANEQVVQFIVLLGKVHREQFGLAPATQRFKQMQHAEVTEIGLSRNRFERVKASVAAIDRVTLIQRVKEKRFEGAHEQFVALGDGLVINRIRIAKDGGNLSRQSLSCRFWLFVVARVMMVMVLAKDRRNPGHEGFSGWLGCFHDKQTRGR